MNKRFEEMTVEELKKYAKENCMKLTSKVKAKFHYAEGEV